MLRAAYQRGAVGSARRVGQPPLPGVRGQGGAAQRPEWSTHTDGRGRSCRGSPARRGQPPFRRSSERCPGGRPPQSLHTPTGACTGAGGREVGAGGAGSPAPRTPASLHFSSKWSCTIWACALLFSRSCTINCSICSFSTRSRPAQNFRTSARPQDTARVSCLCAERAVYGPPSAPFCTLGPQV